MTKLISHGKEIDLTPAEKIISKLEEAVKERKTWKDRKYIAVEVVIKSEIKNLDGYQKDYLLDYFISKYLDANDLYRYALETKSTDKLKEALEKISNSPEFKEKNKEMIKRIKIKY